LFAATNVHFVENVLTLWNQSSDVKTNKSANWMNKTHDHVPNTVVFLSTNKVEQVSEVRHNLKYGKVEVESVKVLQDNFNQ